MSKPLVSIITATFRDLENLIATARSIELSEYQSLEWLVVDAASDDGTVEWLKANGSVVDKWISEPDQGIYDAWNKGLAMADGEWIIFLGAGDLLCSDLLIELDFKQESTADIIYGDLLLQDCEGRRVGVRHGPEWDNGWRRLPCSMSFPHPGMLHRASLFIGCQFSDSYKIVADWEFFLRSDIGNGRYVPGVLQAVMLVGGVSSAAGSVRKHYKERRQLINKGLAKNCFSENLKWRFKLLVAKLPILYGLLQRIRWAGARK